MKKINFIQKISNLETIEEKSFWVIAPLIAFLGLAGLGTAGFYESASPTIISAILCLIIPIMLMIFVYRNKNYHYAYPLLVIFIGGISIPLTFVFSGGFLSGMPIFCAIATAISAFCYQKSWRNISFIACLTGNVIAFYYVYVNGSPYPLDGTYTIYNDIIFGYMFASIGTFFAINLIIVEIRKYKMSQDVLQQYFDIEVRKEILKKAVKGDLSLSSSDKRVVIMFADISNFTTITEKMSSEIISQFLNEFFTITGKYIHETNGIIDKYIGDCVMAYWFEQEDTNCVLNAVKAILMMKKELLEKSEMIYKKYGTELNFSAGVAYGDVIFGDIGSDGRHDYTVIGDAVNTASRIEDYAVGGELLLSDAAAEMVKDSVILEQIEKDLFFKGKNKSINLYRVVGLGNKHENANVESNVEQGYQLYICGCRGSFPVSGLRFSEYGGETSCYVLKKNDYAVIIDCGTGLKNAVDILADCKKIDILLTHVHYDHILGLLMAKLPQDAQIRLYGYFDGWYDGTDTLVNFMEHPYWPVEIKHIDYVGIKLEEEINLDENIRACFYKADHPDEACVINVLFNNKKVCFLADCEDPNKLSDKIASDSDLVFYDGMFDDNDEIKHAGWGHGTWQQGVEYAKRLHPKKLVITHHNPEVADHTLHVREKQARLMAKNVSFAKSGDKIII